MAQSQPSSIAGDRSLQTNLLVPTERSKLIEHVLDPELSMTFRSEKHNQTFTRSHVWKANIMQTSPIHYTFTTLSIHFLRLISLNGIPYIINFCWALEHVQTSRTIAFISRVDQCYPGLKFARWIKHGFQHFLPSPWQNRGKILLDSPFPNQQGMKKCRNCHSSNPEFQGLFTSLQLHVDPLHGWINTQTLQGPNFQMYQISNSFRVLSSRFKVGMRYFQNILAWIKQENIRKH